MSRQRGVPCPAINRTPRPRGAGSRTSKEFAIGSTRRPSRSSLGKGYEGTAIDDITERADFARGTFFNYFQRKDDLITEWAEVRRRAVSERLELPLSIGHRCRLGAAPVLRNAGSGERGVRFPPNGGQGGCILQATSTRSEFSKLSGLSIPTAEFRRTVL
ncbi:TetR/AcrR family transcriptional regulator [Rhodococcus pyridinivorans]|uniref:TetR/AcrR family transcriptional regulator n=1 Tax=Rhodococcus pyridinivorans TaxID=103816 RepID=UPI0037CBF425